MKGRNSRVWLLVLLAIFYQAILTDAQCTQGALRLASNSYSSSYWSGIVEICSLGQWGRVCGAYSNNFGTNEARVICRQLGYSDRGALARISYYSYRSSVTILLTRGLDCQGNETHWLDCNVQPRYSSTCRNGYNNYNAGVRCRQAPTLQVSITTVPRLTSGIALAGTSLTMTCNVSPYVTGIETYHWSSSCSGSCFVKGASTAVLERTVLRVEDSGRHTCRVTRGTSSRSSTMTLTVIEPEISLSISPPFTGMDSPPYEHFTLWCNATTPTQLNLPIVTKWYKDGDEIRNSESMVIESVSRCSSRSCSALIVNDAETSFSGEYMCITSVLIPGSRTVSKTAKTSVVIHGTTEAIIQLHLTGVHHCKDWVFIEAHEKAADISELLTEAIQERCTDCDFSLERLEDSGLVCTDDLNEIVYQTRILSIPKADNHRLVRIITQIVNEEGQTFVVRGLRLAVVPNCAVQTESFIDLSCDGGYVEISGSGDGELSPSSSQGSSTSTVIAIIEGVAIAVVMVIAISSCVICVLLHRRKSPGRFTRLTDHSDVSFERDSGVTISGGLHFRPTTASRAVDDVYEELPLKPDKDDD